MADIVNVNVGGHVYTTTKNTLCRFPDSMLGCMFSGTLPSALDKEGNYFIDRDGTLFRYVLNFLRTSRLVLPKNFTEYELLGAEADFYQIPDLIDAVARRQKESDEDADHDGDIVVIEKRIVVDNEPWERASWNGPDDPGETFSDWRIQGNQQILVILFEYFLEICPKEDPIDEELNERYDLEMEPSIKLGSNELRIKTYFMYDDPADGYNPSANAIQKELGNGNESQAQLRIYRYLLTKLWELGYRLYETKTGKVTDEGKRIKKGAPLIILNGDTFYFKNPARLDGTLFRYVLNFLRTSQLVLPKNFTDYELLVAEADFYQIPDLIDAVAKCRKESVWDPDGDTVVIEKRVLVDAKPWERESWNEEEDPAGKTFSDWRIQGNLQILAILFEYFLERGPKRIDPAEDPIDDEFNFKYAIKGMEPGIKLDSNSNELKIKTYLMYDHPYDGYHVSANSIQEELGKGDENQAQLRIYRYLLTKLWELGYKLYSTKTGTFTDVGIQKVAPLTILNGDTFYLKQAAR
ncbi:uncharacterized protein [Amphiura filiformis]|uniref:uncharacterized protein n=1 Tax=Amphiura filiformis TaxID=82378 RepID=UPI003B20DA0B